MPGGTFSSFFLSVIEWRNYGKPGPDATTTRKDDESLEEAYGRSKWDRCVDSLYHIFKKRLQGV